MVFKNYELIAHNIDEAGNHVEKRGNNTLEVLHRILKGELILGVNDFNRFYLNGDFKWMEGYDSENCSYIFGQFLSRNLYCTPKSGSVLPERVEYGDDKLRLTLRVPDSFRQIRDQGFSVLLNPKNFRLKASEDGREAEVVLDSGAWAKAEKFIFPILHNGYSFYSENGNWFLFSESGGPMAWSNYDNKKAIQYVRDDTKPFVGLGVCYSDRSAISTQKPADRSGVLVGVLNDLEESKNFNEFVEASKSYGTFVEARDVLESLRDKLKEEQTEVDRKMSILQATSMSNLQKISGAEQAILELGEWDGLQKQDLQRVFEPLYKGGII